MKFVEDKHKIFYEEKISIYIQKWGHADSYVKSLFYLLGICQETRQHFSKLFDMKDSGIIVEELNAEWQTGTTQQVCRLAFDLWNGFCYDIDEDTKEKKISREYSVSHIFCCGYAEYFFEAIRLRYPCYCHE